MSTASSLDDGSGGSGGTPTVGIERYADGYELGSGGEFAIRQDYTGSPLTAALAAGTGHATTGGSAEVAIHYDTLVWAEHGWDAYGEGEQAGWFTIHRFGGGTEPLTVHYNTAGGTATPGTDYSSPTASGTVPFADGEAVTYPCVLPINDVMVDDDQSVSLSLSAPSVVA